MDRPIDPPKPRQAKPMPAPAKTAAPAAHDPDEAKENIIAIIVVVIIVAAAGFWIYQQFTTAPESQERVSIPLAGSPTLGASEAKVAVVLFSDFECPFCGQFARESGPVLAELTQNGTVLFVFKQFPLETHPHALDAAHASLCADQQRRFWEYHDVLFSHQGALAPEDLQAYAAGIGLNMTRFDECLARPSIRALEEKRLGQELGVSGTPTFFFNGRKVAGYLTAEEFIAEVRRELEAPQ